MSILHRTCDRVIHLGLVTLIAFTPLAFGTVEPWSIALMEWGIFTLLLVFLLSRLYPEKVGPVISRRADRLRLLGLGVPIGLFLLLCIAQLVPMPMRWLRTLSPGSARMYESVDFASWERLEEKTETVRRDRQDPLLQLPAVPVRPISVNPARTRERMVLLLSLLALFFLVANWADEERAVSILRGVVVVSFLVAMFALVQLLTWNGKLYWVRKVPTTPGVPPTACGPFVNHDHFAGYVEMAIPVALSLAFWLIARRNRPPTTGRAPTTKSGWRTMLLDNFGEDKGRLAKVFLALFAAVILIVSLFFSLSRGGMLSAFISGTVLVALLCRRAVSRGLRWAVALALPILVGLLISWIGAQAVAKQLHTYGNFQEESSYRLRAILWERIVRELPGFAWAGSGLGTFEDSFAPLTPAGSEKRWDKAHNDYLQLVWETGIAGGLLFLAGGVLFFRSYWWPAVRGFARPVDIFRVGIAVALMSIALHSFVDFCLQIGANGFLCALLAGILIALRDDASTRAPGWRGAQPIEGPWSD